VGGFAVQFAKAKGAYIIATDSTHKMHYVKNLLVNKVVDYRSQPLAEAVHDVDLVVEVSPVRDNDERLKAVAVLRPGGRFVSVNVDFPFNEAVLAALAEKQATGKLSANQPKQEALVETAQPIDAG